MTLKGREGDTFEGANLGSEIVVTHNLDKHDKGRTTGSYKINGQAASKAKVKLLAEYLNIQVDNPCVVLTQSVSSAFLRNAKNGENPNPTLTLTLTLSLTLSLSLTLACERSLPIA